MRPVLLARMVLRVLWGLVELAVLLGLLALLGVLVWLALRAQQDLRALPGR